MNVAEQPQKTFRCGTWHIFVYSDGLVCQNSEGNTYEIRASTERIQALPHYLLVFIKRRHLLDWWELLRLNGIVNNITAIRVQHEAFLADQYTHTLTVPQPT